MPRSSSPDVPPRLARLITGAYAVATTALAAAAWCVGRHGS